MNTKAELQRLAIGALHEVTDDISLPDYMPEIERIVSCTSSLLPESRYIDSGELVLSGIAIVCIYYIGGTGELCAFPHNCEYSVKLSCAGSDLSELSADDLVVKSSIESTQCRAVGPRKFSLDLKMRSFVFASHTDSLDFETTSSDGTECTLADSVALELRRGEFEYTALRCATGSGSASGEIRERDGVRIISCEGTAAIFSATPSASRVALKGELYISCLAKDGDGVYSTVRIKAPIEENLTLSSPNAEDSRSWAVGRARCASVKMHGGDGGEFTWEAEYDVEAFVFSECACDLALDAYSSAYESETELSRTRIVKCLAGTNSRLSTNASKQLVRATGTEVVYFTAKASQERSECTSDGKLVIGGTCAVTAILANDDAVTSEDILIPYRFECDCKSSTNASIVSDVTPIGVDGRLDGDRLVVNCELAVSCFALEGEERNYLKEIKLRRDEPLCRSRSELTLYYPTTDEETWDIGKRYHCPISRVRRIDSSGCVIIVGCSD